MKNYIINCFGEPDYYHHISTKDTDPEKDLFFYSKGFIFSRQFLPKGDPPHLWLIIELVTAGGLERSLKMVR